MRIGCMPEQRPAYLEQSCRDDERLKQRVKALLDAHGRADRVLLKPPSSSGSSLAHALDIEFPRDVAGTRIGHYTLSRRIAVGGMGIVYEAQQDNPRRSVALKVMKAGIATKSVMRRFEFETQVLGRLQHPNIAHIHDAGVHDGELGPVPYFAMELIDNAKTIKGQKVGVMTGVLYLAPSTLSGRNVCPQASKGCIAACLNTAALARLREMQS